MTDSPPRAIESALAALPPEDAAETLRAILRGEVDALVLQGSGGPAVYTLTDANHPYRIIIERMSEGAAVLDEGGTLFYCNRRFAELVGSDKSELVGRRLETVVTPEHRRRIDELLAMARSAPAAVEADLAGQTRLPVHLSASPIDIEDWKSCVALIVTDLSARKRSEGIAAAEEFARSILDQAAEPMIVCDGDGIVSHASVAAQSLCPTSPHGRLFDQAFPLCRTGQAADGPVARQPLMLGEIAHGAEVEMTCRGGQIRRFLAGVGPLRNVGGRVIGRVISLADITEVSRQREELVLAKAEAEQARREAEQAREQAELANHAKSHFLAAASHDLRQPFQALRFMIDVLDQQVTDPHLRGIVAAANQALGGGEKLLHALLDISKLEAGAVTPQRQTFPLTSILQQLGSECEGLAYEKGIELVLVNSSAEVDSDPVLLSRLLRNLLHNAIKYAERGRVLMGCRRIHKGVRIEVWDNGIGIAHDQLGRIFDDFYQVGNHGREQAQGLGVGLSVVRRTAELLGHQVTVRSWPGKGSVFAVSITCPKSSADALLSP
jgi:PAS domain S-box-containing protein